MGPSGAGKSSLLNILAGRVATPGKMKVSCPMTCNGESIDAVQFRSRVAYVMQEDALFATQTVREALSFSAALRLDNTCPAHERGVKVEELLAALKLENCADTKIGEPFFHRLNSITFFMS